MLQELFFQGKYKQVLAESLDSRAGTFTLTELPYIIGALTFRGRLHEAEHLYEVHTPALDCEALFVSRFFLGVGFCRQAFYAKSRQYFGKNLRMAGASANGKARFYAWQGLGFYRLTCGRHRDGFRAARKALAGALEANFLWGKTVAYDLMAHNQVLPGQVSAALGSFHEAICYAKLVGDGGVLQALEVSLAIHSAQYGLNPERDIGELERLTKTIASEDNYSKSRLLLELGRQWTVRGDVDAAEAALNEACQLIYGSNNRRYGIQLNLRYAYLMYLRGEHHQALNLIRNAGKELDPEVDRALACEVLGFEQKILKSLGFHEAAAELVPRLTKMSKETGCVTALRILAREGSADLALAKMGDDPLGDLLDLARLGDFDSATRIIDKGFYGLLIHLLPGAVGARALYFDLVPGGVVIFDRGRARYGTAGFSSVIRAIAKALKDGETSKQDLIEKIWGYKYQTLKHDPLIYRNVSRFRALLGRAAAWLEVTESGYRFADGVEIHFREAQAAGATAVPTQTLNAPPPADVNFRQLKLLEHLAKAESLDVKACMALFGMTEITARRDLAHLFKLNLVERLGKGRATCYRGRNAVAP